MSSVQAGSWEFRGRALASPSLQFGRIQVPYVPPEEHDVRAVVERTVETDSIQIGLAYGWNQFLVIVDGPGPGRRKPFYANETTVKGRLVEPYARAAITVSVRRDRIACGVDRSKIIDSLWPSWTMPRRDTPFLGAWTGTRLAQGLDGCARALAVGLADQAMGGAARGAVELEVSPRRDASREGCWSPPS